MSVVLTRSAASSPNAGTGQLEAEREVVGMHNEFDEAGQQTLA